MGARGKNTVVARESCQDGCWRCDAQRSWCAIAKGVGESKRKSVIGSPLNTGIHLRSPEVAVQYLAAGSRKGPDH